MTDLPNLRKTVLIRFWSLRNGLGESLGVINDIDTQVERHCYRVRDGDDWRWQIRGLTALSMYDYCAFTDQDTLDAYGSELEFELLDNSPI